MNAFPRAGHEWDEMEWVPAPAQNGMTLRDYFAAKAMQGWLSTYPDDHAPDEVFEGGVADFAYRIADAMLKAREA